MCGNRSPLLLLVQPAQQQKLFKTRIENALKSSLRKPKSTTMKLAFGLCGCQEENTRGRELGEIDEDCGEPNYRNGIENLSVQIHLEMPLPTSSFVVSVDEWKTIRSGGAEIGNWLLNLDSLEFVDQIGHNIPFLELEECDRNS
ncbi:hypothetical protein LOK49_LG07G00776 [Camellia lanceoleosa]|uniref:Uncharacterized protein n=1 Tax=Camellia lanceoleosa TaxID=1840588 RepID=A0ACC0H7B2_9ERIC|nr:hypothetical protein LOK49_LG07G00776 [Camellia lanceoleosa]